MASEYIRTEVKNLCFNMANLQSLLVLKQTPFFSALFSALFSDDLIQLLDSPVHALFYRGIELWVLLEFLELRHRAFVMQVHQQIDQSNLHQRRLLGL